MNRSILIPTLILCALAGAIVAALAVPSATRAVEGTGEVIPAGSEMEAALVEGNYCIACHLAEDPRLATVTDWKGSIDREANNPCPSARKIHEELYYTDRLLMMIERAQGEAGALPETAQARLEAYTQRYSRLLDAPVNSLDALVSEAQTTRYQLNKIYTLLNAMVEAKKARTVLLYAVAATLIVLGSLGWGLYNTRAIRAGWVSKSGAMLWRGIFVLAVLAFFALPIFRVPAEETAMTTVEQQEAQTILDTAQRAADAADRAQARAWMLAQVGATWGAKDAAQGQTLLSEAHTALAAADENQQALWGQSLAVQEVTVGTRIEMESAGLIARDLNAARGRAWALPLVAVEGYAVDAEAAASLLRQGEHALRNQTGLYRDLQLRSLALAWAKVDAAQAAPLAEQIVDPALRAWTQRELAVLLAEPRLFDLAADSAREIQDPIRRAGAMRNIATASGKQDLFAEALRALEGTTGAARAYALSDLAAASRDEALAGQIDPAYPEARASALLRMGKYAEAWEAAALIADPYEQAQAQAVVAAAWGDAEAANQIATALYRERSLRDVIQKTGNAALVDLIFIPYYKVQALTAIGDLESAIQLSGDLGDTYPLVALAVRLAHTDPQAALAVVNAMSREADKAVALRAIAAATQDQSLFESALGMALAGRVRGDALVPSQASLELALALWDANPAQALAALQQAYEAAHRIAIK